MIRLGGAGLDTLFGRAIIDRVRLAAVAALVVSCFSVSVRAATISDINFSALPGGSFEISLKASEGKLPEPKSFVVDSPARIVLEFPETLSGLKKKKYPLSFENAQSVVVLSAAGTTRMIVNLQESQPFDLATTADGIKVRVGEPEGGGLASSAPVSAQGVLTESKAPVQTVVDPIGNVITDVDFRRGESGEGMVSIGLAEPEATIDVSQVGHNIVLSFYRTNLPESLNRKLDVVDFATPIHSIDSSLEGSTTKFVIGAKGEYDYLAYQTDKQYVVSVKPLSKAELEDRRSRFEYTGEKLSLNFQDIEVRSVLQIIADFTGLNLVASDTVTGSITLRLQNVPWDQALDIVLKSKGLDKRQEGNVLLVAPSVEIAERERLQVEANKQLVELAPLVTEFIRVRYADAGELFGLFDVDDDGGGGGDDETATSSILSERGTAIVDERTNTIILTDVQEKVDEFLRLVKEIDIPIRQVEIEARIVIASTDFRKEIGARWGIAGVRTPGDDVFEFGGSREVLDSDPGFPAAFFGVLPGNATLDLSETLAVDLGVSEPSGSLALGLIKDNTFIDLELSALESDGYGEIVSQPKVLTGDKKKAVIKSGTEIPYESGTSSGETDIEFREAVLKLEVTPQITPDNRIIMDLIINQDSVGEIVPTSQGGSEPTIDVTEVETQALVGDGQTLVLGGIFQTDEIDGEEKVPVLGDIPVIGRLFKNTIRDSTKREILIFVTPRIVSDPLLDQ